MNRSFPRRRQGKRSPKRAHFFEMLESRTLMSVTLDALPSIYGGTIVLPAGKSIEIPLTASTTLNGPLTYTVTASNPALTPMLNAIDTAVSATRTFVRFSTSMGDMVFQLFNDVAPQTVGYLLSHLSSPDFVNSIFHRIIKQSLPTQQLSIIQGGDRNGDGIDDNVGLALEEELDKRVIWTGHGQLGEARTSQADTGGSQFFVTVETQRSFDFNYTIYGQLVRGFDVLTAINNLTTDSNDRPLAPPTLNGISVINDTTDAVLTLLSTSLTPVAGTITVKVKDAAGNSDTKVFNVGTVADTVDDPPFLAPPSLVDRSVPKNATTEVAFGAAVDLEGSSYTISGSALSAHFSGNFPDSTHLSITPDTDYTGPVQVTVRATQNSDGNFTERTYTFFVDTGAGPTYSLRANDLFANAGTNTTFTVTYTDDGLLNAASIINNNNAVTVIGPGGKAFKTTFVSINSTVNGSTLTATYKMLAPGGTWDTPDAGGYYVVINANQVKDTAGNAAAVAAAGAFYYSPSAFFDERYYLSMNPDVGAAIAAGKLISGWQHFQLVGQSEARAATPFFNEKFYDALYPDVYAALLAHKLKSGWQHFVLAGQKEGRYSSPVFDERAYLALNPDVAAAVAGGAFASGLEHFILQGQYENRQSSYFFQINTYMVDNPSVVTQVQAGTVPIFRSVAIQFLVVGQHQGLVANPLFDETYYLTNNPDVATAVANGAFSSGFEHFWVSGAHENRNPSTLFNSQYYLAHNPDVAAAVASGALPSAFYHYILAGQAEGRPGHA